MNIHEYSTFSYSCYTSPHLVLISSPLMIRLLALTSITLDSGLMVYRVLQAQEWFIMG